MCNIVLVVLICAFMYILRIYMNFGDVVSCLDPLCFNYSWWFDVGGRCSSPVTNYYCGDNNTNSQGHNCSPSHHTQCYRVHWICHCCNKIIKHKLDFNKSPIICCMHKIIHTIQSIINNQFTFRWLQLSRFWEAYSPLAFIKPWSVDAETWSSTIGVYPCIVWTFVII